MTLALLLLPSALFSQIPHGFNYQAVLRDAEGQVLKNRQVGIRISILQGDTSETPVWVEEHSVTTNGLGLVTLTIGDTAATPAGGSVTSFEDIDWSKGDYFLRIALDNGSGFEDLKAVPFLSVPYARVAGRMAGGWQKAADTLIYTAGSVAIGTSAPNGSKLAVQGDDVSSSEALFEVKRKDGQPVFSVYNDSVVVHVNDAATKGPRGGFIIGGFGPAKGGGQDYLRVTPDSVRIYINATDTKGPRGGFAIGGFGPLKGSMQEYLRVTDDSTRIYINDQAKGPRGGFAIGGFGPLKGQTNEYFNVSTESDAAVISPSQPRILWYPKKEAFLTGRVLIESPDSVGTNSMATGYESKAIGNYSQALGYQAVARGDYSTAIGKYAVADSASFALGSDAVASGLKSYALGLGAQATGEGSFALGSLYEPFNQITSATGDYSYALGLGAKADTLGAISMGMITKAYGISSVAMGNNSDALGSFSVAMGYGNIAKGGSSIAMGFSSLAEGSHSVTLGNQSIARGYETTVMGYKNVARSNYSIVGGQYNDTTLTNTLFELGWGSHSTRKNVFTVFNNGTLKMGSSLQLLAPNDTGEGLFFSTQGSDNQTGGRIFFCENQSNLYGFSIAYNGENTAGALLNYPGNTFGISNHDNSVDGHLALAIRRSNGYVGINNSYPVDQLHVNGNIRGNKFLTLQDYDGGTDISQFISRDNCMLVWGDALVVGNYSNGAVPSVVAHEGYLHVKNRISVGTTFNAFTLSVGDHMGVMGSIPTISLMESDNSNFTSDIRLNGGRMSFVNAGIEILSLYNQKLGIRTTNPQYTLHVNGSIRSENAITAWGGVYAGSGLHFGEYNDFANDDFYIYKSGNDLLFKMIDYPNQDNNQFFMSFDGPTGRVGIGTSIPVEKLHVYENARYDGYAARIQHDGNSYRCHGLNIVAGADGSSSGTTYMITFRDGNGTPVGTITMKNSAISYNQTSDRRLKTNIREADFNGIETVKELPVVNYAFKQNPEAKLTGFIAQDVMKVFPEAVSENDEGFKQLSLSSLIPVLTKAIQEQQQIIEAQGKEIARLKKEQQKLAILQERLEKMERLLNAMAGK